MTTAPTEPDPSQQSAWILLIDQGGHASRALVIDTQGQIQGQAEVAISATTSPTGHIEYPPEELLASLKEVIQQATANIDVQRIQAAAMATQRSNIICWDKGRGQPLSPIISWQDRRAHAWLAGKKEHAAFVHAQTGLPLSPHYGASKLHWCLNHIQAVRQAEQAQRLAWGPMASWLTRQLCEESPFVCDPVNASRTLLWSLQRRDWSAPLLQRFELPEQQGQATTNNTLPTSVSTFFNFGHLNIKGHPVPLQLVTGDQAAALYAFGTPQTDTAYITVGTGAFVLNPCGRQALFDKQLLSSIVRSDKEGADYALEGTVNGAGCALDHYAQRFNQPDTIARMPEWLTQIENPPLFLNGYAGLGTPFMRAQFPSRFIGDGNEQNRLVAVIESIVFLLQSNLDRMKLLNPTLQHIVIGGGLARFDGLCQRLADLDMAVNRPAQTETTTQGLARLLFQAMGLHYEPTPSPQEHFGPQINPALQQRYRRWQQAMQAALAHDHD